MNRLIIASAIGALALSPLSANADISNQAKPYIGGAAQFLSYEEPGVDTDHIVVAGRLGAFFNQYIAAEARLGLGVVGDETNAFGPTIDIDLNYVFGAYLRGGVPVNDVAFPYVLLGYSRGEVEASANGVSIDEAESDVSFGFGLDVKVNDKFSVFGEYANLLDKDGAEVSGFSFGLAVNF